VLIGAFAAYYGSGFFKLGCGMSMLNPVAIALGSDKSTRRCRSRGGNILRTGCRLAQAGRDGARSGYRKNNQKKLKSALD